MCTGGAESAPGVAVYDMYGNQVEVQEFEVDSKFTDMPHMWANHVNTGEEIYDILTLDKNMEIMAILDAVITSAKSGKEEKIGD